MQQLHTAVASHVLLLPVDPHEAKGVTECDLPPSTRIKDSLVRTENSLETFDFILFKSLLLIL